jgi:hypothetical protein
MVTLKGTAMELELILRRMKREADALTDTLRSREAAQIANCVAAHSSMPEHYWQERWKAEQRSRTLAALLEVITA